MPPSRARKEARERRRQELHEQAGRLRRSPRLLAVADREAAAARRREQALAGQARRRFARIAARCVASKGICIKLHYCNFRGNCKLKSLSYLASMYSTPRELTPGLPNLQSATDWAAVKRKNVRGGDRSSAPRVRASAEVAAPPYPRGCSGRPRRKNARGGDRSSTSEGFCGGCRISSPARLHQKAVMPVQF